MRHPDGQRDGSADRTGTPTVGYKKTDPGYPDRFVEKMATPTLASDRIGLPEFALFRPLRRAVRPVLPATVRFSGRPECGTATNGTRSLTNETAHRVLRKLRAKPRSRRRFPRRAIPKPRLQRPDPAFRAAPYYQVFTERYPFAANLSIIDLLFCEGPDSTGILRNSTVR